MTDSIPDEIMREAIKICDPSFSGGTRVYDAQHIVDVARALLRERQRAAEIADRWLSTFGSREIKHTSAREYACDAVSDIRDAILSYDEAQK